MRVSRCEKIDLGHRRVQTTFEFPKESQAFSVLFHAFANFCGERSHAGPSVSANSKAAPRRWLARIVKPFNVLRF